MKRMSTLMSAVALALGLGLVFGAAAPAGAAVVGGGGVTGTVKLEPGISLETNEQAFTFQGVVIEGTFTNAEDTFAGLIAIDDPDDLVPNTVFGGSNSAGDDSIFGEGYVELFTLTPVESLTESNLSGNCTAGTKDASGATHANGGYTRVGSIVLLKLLCDVTIDDSSVTDHPVYVAAQFSPTVGDGVVVPATEANFTGTYATAS